MKYSSFGIRFSLVEIVIAIGLVGLIASIGVHNFIKAQADHKAKDKVVSMP